MAASGVRSTYALHKLSCAGCIQAQASVVDFVAASVGRVVTALELSWFAQRRGLQRISAGGLGLTCLSRATAPHGRSAHTGKIGPKLLDTAEIL